MTAGHARRRNLTWSVTIVVIACCASASCSSSVSLDMTLRNREEMRAQVACAGGSFNGTKRTCRLRFQDQVWSNGAGRGVVVPAYTVTFEVVDHDYGTGECGGRAVTGDSASSTAPGVISDRGLFHSDGDDASAVELAPQQGLWVGGFADSVRGGDGFVAWDRRRSRTPGRYVHDDHQLAPNGASPRRGVIRVEPPIEHIAYRVFVVVHDELLPVRGGARPSRS